MTRSALPPLVTVLMLVAVCPAHATAQTLLVQVDNDAWIPAAALLKLSDQYRRARRAQLSIRRSPLPQPSTKGAL
jgi:hypothetical protein